MRSGVLDVVLALHRSPTLRHALRERPLPDGIDVVLRLAAASQPALDDTAARMGVAPDTLLEAARFYLQQVLFEPGTDAYRILGVPPDAPPERIRDHHRWLQRWLHPDRDDAGWASPFASRLNWAWQQLRNERSRGAYDAERARALSATADDPPAARRRRGSQWATVPVPASAQPGRWWRRGVLGVALAGCGLLLFLALTRGGPSYPTPQSGMQAGLDAPSVTKAAAAPRPGSAPAEPPRSMVDTAAPAIPVAPQLRPALAAVPPVRVATSLPRSPSPASAATRHPAAQRHPAPDATWLATATHGNPQPESAAVPPRAAATPAPAHARAIPATGADTTTTPPAAPLPAPVLLQRVELARERVHALVAYFRSSGSGAPDWPDAGAPFNALLQRAALRQRNGLPVAATFALEAPVWRMADARIAMRAGYRVERDREVIEHGSFRVDMTWQDHAWLITRIELEPQG